MRGQPVGPTKEGTMKGSRRTAAAAVVLGTIAMLVLSGTAVAQETDATTDEPVTFTVGVDSDITSMNPFNLCCGPDYEYLELI